MNTRSDMDNYKTENYTVDTVDKDTNNANTDNYADDAHVLDLSKEISRKAASNPEFLRLWNESENEYELLFQVIRLRKKQKISQKELAVKTGTKQEVISRMESRKNSPSLANFCKIVNTLGYELIIQKKI